MKNIYVIVAGVTTVAGVKASASEPVSYFSIDELVRSETAARCRIDNTPPAEAVEWMKRLIAEILDPARKQLGLPVRVNSGYRCRELNSRVGGVKNSYHLYGRAADITAGSVADNRRLWDILGKLPHSELIWERGGQWIHVAL